MPKSYKVVEGLAAIEGLWKIEKNSITYNGTDETPDIASTLRVPYGIALSGVRFGSGWVVTTVSLSSNTGAGRILLGFSSLNSRYITVGIGGYGEAYVIEEFDPRTGWRRLGGAGKMANLRANSPYLVEVELEGQRISLKVDSIKVLDHVLSGPLEREQVGLFTWGADPVSFTQFGVSTQPPSAFIVMQFTGPFNELYEDVIKPVCAELGVEAYRASDIYRPGVIIQDITQGLAESHVVIADITPPNPNVFYELGYAHALQKPVIMLADREAAALPFDISGYRAIFYGNTIRGKGSLEADLCQHLTNILGQ
jgi:hypothetical protein